jgi:hypothetical protein
VTLAVVWDDARPLLMAAAAAAPPPEAELTAQELHDLFVERADAGDDEAADAIAAIDAYLAERGLSLDDLPPPTLTVDHVTDGPVVYRLEGRPPWYLDVTNDTTIGSLEQLEAYRTVRHAAVRALAASTPDRVIEVTVSPDTLVGIAELTESLDCGCVPTHVVADVWRDGAWVGEGGGADEAELLGMVDGARDDGVEATVRRLRLAVPASLAVRLVEAEHVLLVDPVDDIHDRFADRAAMVEVVRMPDVFRAWARFELGVDLVPGAMRPSR